MKLLSIVTLLTLFLSALPNGFAYEIQPGDNAVVSSIYSRIDTEFAINPEGLLATYMKMPVALAAVTSSPQYTYYLEKMQEYTRNRLFEAHTSPTFACFDTYAQYGDTVTIDYSLQRDTDDAYIQLPSGTSVRGQYTALPLIFTLGVSNVPNGITHATTGMRIGKTEYIEANARSMYGSYAERLVVESDNAELAAAAAVGKRVRITQKDDSVIQGVIRAITGSKVMIDFNHPSAGAMIYGTLEVEQAFKGCGDM